MKNKIIFIGIVGGLILSSQNPPTRVTINQLTGSHLPGGSLVYIDAIGNPLQIQIGQGLQITTPVGSNTSILSVNAILGRYSGGEKPTGIIDGLNNTFTLLFAPNPALALVLTRNGLVLNQGVDYTLNNNGILGPGQPTGVTITFISVNNATPKVGDSLVAYYPF